MTQLSRHRLSGASLIEMLVATLLLAVGLLAMASLQASSTQLGKDAEYRAIASELALGFGEAVKANAGGAATYNNAQNNFVLPAPPVNLLTNCSDLAAACTNAQVAQQDMSQFLALARARLPNGQARIVYVAGAGNAPSFIDLWVAWLPTDTRTGDGAVDNQLANGCPAGFDGGNVGARCQYFRISP